MHVFIKSDHLEQWITGSVKFFFRDIRKADGYIFSNKRILYCSGTYYLGRFICDSFSFNQIWKYSDIIELYHEEVHCPRVAVSLIVVSESKLSLQSIWTRKEAVLM